MTQDELVEQISGFLVGMHRSRDFDLPATWSVLCRSGFSMAGTGDLLGDKMTIVVEWEDPDREPSDVLHVTAINEQGIVAHAELREGELESPSPRRLN